MPSESGWPHLPNWAAEKSLFPNPSITQSAAISPDFNARKTPDEYIGSRNPNASPIRIHPSPAHRREEYEKSDSTYTWDTRVAFASRGTIDGVFWISSSSVCSGLVSRLVISRSISPTTPTETMSSGSGMYQNQPSWFFVESTSVAPSSRGFG